MSDDPRIEGVHNPNRLLDEQLNGYIFDETKVLKSVPFAQFVTNNDELAVGLLLPKENQDKQGIPYQELQPVVITSKRTFHPIFKSENRALGVKFFQIPTYMKMPYSLSVIPAYLNGARKSKNPRELYEIIKGFYEEHVYFLPQWYPVHACWDMATYFFMLFKAFPYMSVEGVMASGKSKVLTLSSCLTFNASSILTSPSEASLFRLVNDQRPTLYIDEAENLFRVRNKQVEHDGRVEVINSGYNQEGSVPRVEKLGNKFVTLHYTTYCPKMIASIKGLYGATQNRAIVHATGRAPDNDSRGEREVDREDKRFQEVKDELLLFALDNWREVRDAYNALPHDKRVTSLKKRYLQLWRPLLSVAVLLGDDVFNDLLQVALQQQAVGKGEEYNKESWEYHFLERSKALLKGGHQIILFKELSEALPMEEKPSSKTVRKVMDRLGFRDYWIHTENGNGYRFNNYKEFERIAIQLIPSLFSSSSSLSSESPEIELSETDKLNVPEENSVFPEERTEGTEGTERNEAVFEMNDLLEAMKTINAIATTEYWCELFPNEPVEHWLKELSERGEVYSPRTNHWGVLR